MLFWPPLNQAGLLVGYYGRPWFHKKVVFGNRKNVLTGNYVAAKAKIASPNTPAVQGYGGDFPDVYRGS
jgi:hypothetical protein